MAESFGRTAAKRQRQRGFCCADSERQVGPGHTNNAPVASPLATGGKPLEVRQEALCGAACHAQATHRSDEIPEVLRRTTAYVPSIDYRRRGPSRQRGFEFEAKCLPGWRAQFRMLVRARIQGGGKSRQGSSRQSHHYRPKTAGERLRASREINIGPLVEIFALRESSLGTRMFRIMPVSAGAQREGTNGGTCVR